MAAQAYDRLVMIVLQALSVNWHVFSQLHWFEWLQLALVFGALIPLVVSIVMLVRSRPREMR